MTDQRKFSYSIRTVNRWNRLPDENQTGSKPGGLQKERPKNSNFFEFQRNRDQNKDSVQGTPVNLLR
jgi:hypothetical protein